MASTRNPKMKVYRIARLVDGVLQTVVFVGTFESIPPGWSYSMRYVGRVAKAAA